MRTYKIAVMPGDGIGPEVVAGALAVLKAAEERFGFTTEQRHIAGGANDYLETGKLFADYADELSECEAILFGSMGDPRVTPGILERGYILAMRQGFQQSANVRPVRLYPGVETPIKNVTHENCDFVIVRENTEGSYVGQGSTVHEGTPNAVAMQESLNTRQGIERVVDYAFRLALGRRKKLTLCHKTNVLVAAGKLWQTTVNELAKLYPEVSVDYCHVDAMCFHMPLDPARFDVVVTDNLFGDIITDLGAVIQGGLGVSTSANVNLEGTHPSMFEAIHGSAPDIAGKGWANPAGSVLSLSLLLGHLGEGKAAAAIEAATVRVIGELKAMAGPEMGLNTAEIGQRIAELVAAGDYDTELIPDPLVSTLATLPASRRG